MYAVEMGLESVVVASFEHGVNLEDFDNNGWTAIMYAARRGELTIVQKLLQYGVDLNVSSNNNNYTPLHLAAGSEMIDVCLALIKGGSDPQAKDSSGKIPQDHLKSPENIERYIKLCESTYLHGKTCEQINKARVLEGAEISMNRAMDLINKSAKNHIQKMKEVDAAALAAAAVAATTADKIKNINDPPIDHGPTNYHIHGHVSAEGDNHSAAGGSEGHSQPSHAPSQNSWLPNLFHLSATGFYGGDSAAHASEGKSQDAWGSRSRSQSRSLLYADLANSEHESETQPPKNDAMSGSRSVGMDPPISSVKVLSLDDLAAKGVDIKDFLKDVKDNVESTVYKDRTFAFKKKKEPT